jgi:hypothetical protein
LTESAYARRLLDDWSALQRLTVKIVPREYKRALAAEGKRRPDPLARAASLVAAEVDAKPTPRAAKVPASVRVSS